MFNHMEIRNLEVVNSLSIFSYDKSNIMEKHESYKK